MEAHGLEPRMAGRLHAVLLRDLPLEELCLRTVSSYGRERRFTETRPRQPELSRCVVGQHDHQLERVVVLAGEERGDASPLRDGVDDRPAKPRAVEERHAGQRCGLRVAAAKQIARHRTPPSRRTASSSSAATGSGIQVPIITTRARLTNIGTVLKGDSRKERPSASSGGVPWTTASTVAPMPMKMT